MNDPALPNGSFADEPDSAPEGSQRARSGTGGLGWKIILWLLFIGLVPTIVLVSNSWSLIDSVQSLRSDVTAAYTELRQQADSLAQRVNSLQQEIQENQVLLAQAAREQSARKGMKDLEEKINPLVAGKKAEEVTTDKKVKAVLQESLGTFSEAGVLDSGAKNVLVLKSDKQPGPTEKVLPWLFQKYSSEKKSPAFSEPDWHWTALGRSGFILAVKVNPAPKSELTPAPPVQRPDAGLAGLQKLESFEKAASRRAWILLIALPLLTLVLILTAYWWMHSGLVSPLRRISQHARRLIEDPDTADPESLSRPGQLSDLAINLNRCLERMRRLAELDITFAQTREQMERIREVLKEASHGYLSRRIEISPGECERLALECNLLLDSAAERLEGFRKVGSHLRTSAERLTELSGQLAKSLQPADSEPQLADPSQLGDVLGMRLESLCQSANQMADGVLKDAPASWIGEDNETHMNSLGSATTGLRVLVQRTNEVKSYSDQMGSVRQEAEVLSTNLAIAAEAHSWSQIEKLIDKTHSLANKVTDISDSLTSDLDQLVRSVVGVAEIIEQANERYVDCIDRLLSWENLLESFHRHRGDLLGHIGAVRPAASTLGSDIRRLFETYQRQHKTIIEKRDSLNGVSESSQALAKTASEMLSLIQKVETPSLAPATVTRNLAERQKALETAIRDLTSLAAEEGIHSLSPDASEILERIRSVAEKARKRISDETGAKA